MDLEYNSLPPHTYSIHYTQRINTHSHPYMIVLQFLCSFNVYKEMSKVLFGRTVPSLKEGRSGHRDKTLQSPRSQLELARSSCQ